MSESSLLDDLSYLDDSIIQEDFVYVGFWKRAMALLVDGLVISVINYILMLFIGYSFGFISYSFFIYLYYPIMHCSVYQATLGKRALNIKVVNKEGGRLSFFHALGRFMLMYLSCILFIGFIMAAFTQKKQSLHDLIAGTFVVEI